MIPRGWLTCPDDHILSTLTNIFRDIPCLEQEFSQQKSYCHVTIRMLIWLLNLPGLTTTYLFSAKRKLGLYVISQATSTSNIEAPFGSWNVTIYGAGLPLKNLVYVLINRNSIHIWSPNFPLNRYWQTDCFRYSFESTSFCTVYFLIVYFTCLIWCCLRHGKISQSDDKNLPSISTFRA